MKKEIKDTIILYSADVRSILPLPYADEGIRCGFPSPAQDYIEQSIDLNKELIDNPESTFYGRVVGDNALLLFIGTLGLFVPIRELDSEIGLICVTAAYTFGLGWALWHPKWGSLATGAAIGAAILAYDNLNTEVSLLT